MLRQAVLIVNTQARSGRLQFRAAVDLLQDRGFELTEAVAARNPAKIPVIVREAILNGAPLVIIGGGDGTLSSTLSCFVGSSSVLGVLPLGTGNQFARDLGIPCDVVRACEILASGKVACV